MPFSLNKIVLYSGIGMTIDRERPAAALESAAHDVGSAIGSAAYLATGDGLFSEEVARIGTRAMGAVTGAYLVSRGARAFFHPNPLMERMTGESIVKIFDAAASARARVGYSARLTSADFTVNPCRSVAARLESRPIVPWHKGIHERGMAYEDFVARRFNLDERLPRNYKTFDFHTDPAGVAISVKTLDTQTPSRLARPERVYHSLKKSIDADTDFEALFNLLINKEVMRYSVRGPYSKEQTKDLMLFTSGRYKKYPLGIWAVTEKHNDIPIGICGFIPLEDDDTQYEISYRFLPDFQGKGFATEAALALRDYAAGLEINEFIAFVAPENKPSIRVAKKMGMRFLKNDTYKGIPIALYKYEHSEVKDE